MCNVLFVLTKKCKILTVEFVQWVYSCLVIILQLKKYL